MELEMKAKGTVNVNCDLTSEPYDQKIKADLELVVKFGDEYNDDNDEILIIPTWRISNQYCTICL